MGRRRKKGRFRKWLKKQHKKRVKRVKKVAKKIGKVAKKIVKATVGSALMAPLLPFLPGMKRMLKKKGVSTKRMSFPKTVEVFYKTFVKKKNNFEDNWLDPTLENLEDHVAFRTPIDEYSPDEDHAIGTAISAVVSGIIALFKGLKKKKKKAKDEGIPPEDVMSSDELNLADEAIAVTQALKEEESKSTPESKAVRGMNKNMKKYIKYGLIAVIGILALYMFMNKK